MSIFNNTNNDYNSREIFGLKSTNSPQQNYNIIKQCVDKDSGTWYISYPGDYIINNLLNVGNTEIILLKGVNITLSNGMSALTGNVTTTTNSYSKNEANLLFLTPNTANVLYLSSNAATSFYYTKDQANATFLTTNTANVLYLSSNAAINFYYTKTEANNQFLSLSNANNYLTKAQANTWFVANTTYWEDLRFPAFGINPAGSPAPPTANNMFGWFEYDPATINIFSFQAQMPHAWREGSTIHPHLHWMKTTNGTGNVVWRMEYRWVPIGEVMDTTWKESIRANTMPVTPDSNTAFKHLMTEFDDISGQGKQLSDMLLIMLSRNANTAADNYASAAAYLEFDLHYEVDRLGSQTAEYAK